MSVVHEYYRFSPDCFVDAMACDSERLHSDPVSGFVALREKAFRAYDSSSWVRKLAAEYGAYDRRELESELMQSESVNAAAALLILLYDALKPVLPDRAHVGSSFFTSLGRSLDAIGWSRPELDMVGWGRGFDDLIRRWCRDRSIPAGAQLAISDIWARINPITICGSAGWLDHADCIGLNNKLSELDPGAILSQTKDIPLQGRDYLKASIDVLKGAFQCASENGFSLCIIVSG